MKNKKFNWSRVLAIILVITLVLSYYATALINVKIVSDTDNAAKKYLADKTEYVNESRKQRLWNQIKTLQRPSDLESYYRLASTKIAAEKYEEAVPYIDKCLELTKDTDQSAYIELLIKKGCLLTLLEKDKEAVEVLNGILEIDNKQSDVYLILAQICYKYNDLEGLQTSLASYLALKPDTVEVRETYGQLLFTQGDLDGAKQQYLAIVDLNPPKEQMNEAKHYLSLIYLQKGEFEDALLSLEAISGERETYPDIDCNLGLCYMRLGEYDKAINSYTLSIDSEYAVQYSYYTRGICEFSNEKADLDAAYNDLLAAKEYKGEDRDEETAKLAQEMIDAIFTNAD